MDLVPVSSSSVNAVGYDPDTRMLEIEFRGGRIYRYADVPPQVHAAMMAAGSIGRFVNNNIRGQYRAS